MSLRNGEDIAAVAELFERTFRAIYAERRGPREIHAGQWSILRYLAAASAEDRTAKAIGAWLGVSHAPVSRAVSSLRRRGFVTIQNDEDDRRIRRIHLTAQGREALGADPIHRLYAAVASLPASEHRTFAKVLGLLHRSLVQNKLED